MKVEQDEYGHYEKEDGRRRYLKIKGERAERWVSEKYPHYLSNKKFPPYRNYMLLRKIGERLKSTSTYDDVKDHIEDALDQSLPLPVRRMHYDIVGAIVFQWSEDSIKTEVMAMWNAGGGI